MQVFSLQTGHSRFVDLTSDNIQASTTATTTVDNTSQGIATPELILECTASGNVLCAHLKARGDYLLIGDILRSMTLYQYKDKGDGASGGKLVEVSRDYSVNNMRGVEFLGDSNEIFLGADQDCNLFSLKRLSDGDEERAGRLEPHGYFHLGDWVNIIRSGSLNSQPNENTALNTSAISASAAGQAQEHMSIDESTHGTDEHAGHNYDSLLYGTVSGAIGTILVLDAEQYAFFAALERAVRDHTTGINTHHFFVYYLLLSIY